MNQLQNNPNSLGSKILKVIGTVSFIAVIIIQNYLRTSDALRTTLGSFWLGILPNFFGALGICIALYSTHLLQLKRFQFTKKQLLVLSIFISSVILIIWEFLQIINKRPFDINDVYITIVGSIIGGLLILTLDKLWSQKK